MPLPRPFIATAGNLWRPGIKPNPSHTAEYAPHGVLSASLTALILFENCAKPGFIDYVRPWNKLTFAGAGTSQTATVSPYGGRAFSTAGDANNDNATYATDSATVTVWSVSSMIKFDGTGAIPLAGVPVLFCNNGITTGMGVNGGNDQWQYLDGSGELTPVVTTWSTWTRITVTADGTNLALYANGALQSTSTPNSTSVTLHSVVVDFPWPVSDFFFWSRKLSAAEVASHYADPFGTTMRPKMDEWTVVGTPVVGTVKKQGLLTTGVGP